MRVAIYMMLDNAEFLTGWNESVSELEATIKATLHELNGDDGAVYVPKVLGIDVDDE